MAVLKADHSKDEVDGSLNSEYRRVYAQVVVVGIAPFFSGKILIVRCVGFVHLAHLFLCSFVIHLIKVHDPLDPQLLWSGEENADVGHIVVGQDLVGATAHDNEVLPFGQIKNKVGLVEKKLRLSGEGRGRC